jgi:hypothetical protein
MHFRRDDNTFEEVRQAVAPALGGVGAILVSGSTALVTALVASIVLSKALKPRWY